MSADDRKAPDAGVASVSGSHADDSSAGCRYRILQPLADGGSATLSIALAEGIAGFSKLVVLKTIRDELAQNARATRTFLEEARLSALMNHPNVVQVYEVFLQRSAPVIVMEYLDGQPLNAILARAGDGKALPSLELIVAILAQVLAGLHYAHTLHDVSGEPLGLIHRDVSPHNVMVTYDGQVKLIDFGIAKLARSEHRTRTGVVKGKLTYMAPEQFTSAPDHRADIFGVGVMLWEFAARRRYWGDSLEPAIIGRLVSGQLPHLQARAELDADVSRICDRALSLRPEDRYASAAEMQADLERYLATRGAIINQRAIGEFVSRTCPEDRATLRADIRGQLSDHGLSWTDSGDGLTSPRVRPKQISPGATGREREPERRSSPDSTSGERVYSLGQRPHHTSGAPTSGAHPSGPHRSPYPLETPSRTPDATLRALSEAATREFATSPEALREASASEARPPVAGDEGSSDGAPLRLTGGASPMARAVVAIAGFGTIAALVFALGLGAPERRPGPAASAPPLESAVRAAEPAPSVPSVPSVKAETQPPPASRIRIVASAQPKTAKWYVDDVEMASNPLRTSAPRDQRWHTLRAEAKGFEPFVDRVRFEDDVDVTVVLSPR